MGVGSTVVESKDDNVVKVYPYESIECVECGGEAVHGTTTLEQSYDDKELTIRNVPVLKCVSCGEDYISTTVMAEASKLAKNNYDVTGITVFDYNIKQS